MTDQEQQLKKYIRGMSKYILDNISDENNQLIINDGETLLNIRNFVNGSVRSLESLEKHLKERGADLTNNYYYMSLYNKLEQVYSKVKDGLAGNVVRLDSNFSIYRRYRIVE